MLKNIEIPVREYNPEKCLCRYVAEEYIRKNETLPKHLYDCEECTGLPENLPDGCVSYTTIDHLVEFQRHALHDRGVVNDRRNRE